ncbi:response regulator [Candidatus Woesearchaeota archaeon]|nr:response regulator [Candidatus Woesearchaeota archaeon]
MTQQQQLEILVIDDKPCIVLSFYQTLKDKGVRLDVVQTTADGLDLMTRKRYDLLFTDLMQQPSGIEVYRTAVSKGIEAYIMTGGGALLEEARAVAGESLLMKPFLIKEVIYPIIEKARQRKLEPPKP